MANILTSTVDNLVEWIGSKGEVLAVTIWTPATFYQIDLHLPATDMAKWTTIHRMKCRVAQFAFRDYSPTQWNAANRTCRLYIEAGHNGPGSNWVRSLQPRDTVTYTISPTQPVPTNAGKILCLGDGSALGHFLALKQLTDRSSFPMEAAVVLNEKLQLPQSLRNDDPEFTFLTETIEMAGEKLYQWLAQKPMLPYSSIYLNGSIPMVQHLRRKLKAIPNLNAKLFVQGFWQ